MKLENKLHDFKKSNDRDENTLIKDLMNRIEEFKNLESNWDTYNADKISPAGISNAKQIVNVFGINNIIFDCAFPMRDGGVQLEINSKGCNIEIEVSLDSDIKLLVFNKVNNLILEKNFKMIDLDKLIARVHEYYGEFHYSGKG